MLKPFIMSSVFFSTFVLHIAIIVLVLVGGGIVLHIRKSAQKRQRLSELAIAREKIKIFQY